MHIHVLKVRLKTNLGNRWNDWNNYLLIRLYVPSKNLSRISSEKCFKTTPLAIFTPLKNTWKQGNAFKCKYFDPNKFNQFILRMCANGATYLILLAKHTVVII